MLVTNTKQLDKARGENLPIVSQGDKVQKNSMRLYAYLVCLSKFVSKNKPRRFYQKDFTLAKISKELRMKNETIKKYWQILEDTGLVVYNGRDNRWDYSTWGEAFMTRKKYTLGYYELSKEKTQYRIVPRETLDKIRTDFLVDETELKLYLFLANLQEQYLNMGYNEAEFTLKEARELMGLKKETKTYKRLYLALLWLMKINLIKARIETKMIPNYAQEISYFVIEKVNYYTDGGELARVLTNEQHGVIPNDIKNALLNEEPLVKFED